MDDPIVIIAKVFSDAEDAPTSFEPEEWIEGFQYARSAIACRIALELGMEGEDKDQFLTACGIPEDEECTNHTDTGRGVCADCQQPIEGSRYA